MTLYEWLKFGHVVGAIAWVGAGIYGTWVSFRLVRASRRDRLTVIRALSDVGALFSIAAALVVGLGVWMVIDSPAITFGDAWVLIGFGGIVLSGVVQGAFVGPQSKALSAELERDDPAADDRYRRIVRVNALDPLILVIVVWAMVAKPGV